MTIGKHVNMALAHNLSTRIWPNLQRLCPFNLRWVPLNTFKPWRHCWNGNLSTHEAVLPRSCASLVLLTPIRQDTGGKPCKPQSFVGFSSCPVLQVIHQKNDSHLKWQQNHIMKSVYVYLFFWKPWLYLNRPCLDPKPLQVIKSWRLITHPLGPNFNQATKFHIDHIVQMCGHHKPVAVLLPQNRVKQQDRWRSFCHWIYENHVNNVEWCD